MENLRVATPLLMLDTSHEIAKRVVQIIIDGAGLGGVDAPKFQLWIKAYEDYNKEFQEEVNLFVEWMKNESLSWTVICAFFI